MLRFLMMSLVLVVEVAYGAESTFDCVLEPAQLVRVGSSTAGIIDEVMVERGDFVERGQVLARLKSSVQEAIVEIFRVQATSTATIKAHESRVSFSRKRLERAKVLWEKKLMPSDTYDQLVSELILAENELARGLVEHRITQLEHERSKLILEGLKIRSPISGIISERSVSGGEFVHEAKHVVVVATLDPLHVEVYLPVTMFPHVKVGMTGFVEPAAPMNGRYAATITVVDRVFDAASGSFGVRLSLPNGHGLLPAGHRCKVTFVWSFGQSR